jgi:hypothetical protein
MIQESVNEIIGVIGPALKELGMSIDPKMPQIKGRVLNPPAISYSGNAKVQPRLGKWDMKQSRFLTVKPELEKLKWGYVSFDDQAAPG